MKTTLSFVKLEALTALQHVIVTVVNRMYQSPVPKPVTDWVYDHALKPVSRAVGRAKP